MSTWFSTDNICPIVAMLELMYDHNMMVVVSSNTTPGKVTEKPAPTLLRTKSAANSKVQGHSLVVTDEIPKSTIVP